ncbi:MAG TPA: hypothetical protein VLG50_04035 [Candidatus Saccharimonadales bacterium]|nr:hypothetical protein [Candidatus Saccharimonadales bacterium]
MLYRILFFLVFFFCSTIDTNFPSAKESFLYLNKNPLNPFALSFGMSEAQASFQSLQNTANPLFILTQLQKIAEKQSDRYLWLSSLDRIWYILRSLPKIQCKQCTKIIDPELIDIEKEKLLLEKILNNIAANTKSSMLAMNKCPFCNSSEIVVLPKLYRKLTEAYYPAVIAQINSLNIPNQLACKDFNFPNYRYSPESCSILKNDSLEVDPLKLAQTAQFIKAIGNPIIFLHNYANPLVIPNLFEKSEHIDWFADYCAQVIKACPHVTHVCPIVQPLGFAYRVAHSHNLPPFEINIPMNNYLSNIVQAHIQACKNIKKINPKIVTLVSHQWKIMKPKHSVYDPRGILERVVCKIANYLYNEKFVELFKAYKDHFDAISLSLYPPVVFDGWVPDGNNVSGVIDADAALQSILQMHQAFPDKDIYIGETSCNAFDPVKKKEFIDMTLYVCKLAREKGVPLKGVYFWSHSNDFYSEWNKPPHSTNLAPFDILSALNPIGCMNAGGKYLRVILS